MVTRTKGKTIQIKIWLGDNPVYTMCYITPYDRVDGATEPAIQQLDDWLASKAALIVFTNYYQHDNVLNGRRVFNKKLGEIASYEITGTIDNLDIDDLPEDHLYKMT